MNAAAKPNAAKDGSGLNEETVCILAINAGRINNEVNDE
jgi:hypothetical protein